MKILSKIIKTKGNNNKKKRINICIGLSDIHFGHEGALYETFHYCIDKLIDDLKILKDNTEINKVFLILNGDIVSGTFVYRNQYLENQVQKDEDIILAGAYLIHEIVEEFEEILEKQVKIFIVRGNHEGWYRPHPENFSVGISRRLMSYGHDSRYVSNYLILNIAQGFDIDEYNIAAFHSWGNADYSSASPSVVREMTRAHSQNADRGKIIQRFLISHTHWMEINRSSLGVRFDVTGGFQRWNKTISFRETGLVYYLIDDEGNFEVNGVSGLKKQFEEERNQRLHIQNLQYVADLMGSAINYEIEIALLKEPIEGLEYK